MVQLVLSLVEFRNLTETVKIIFKNINLKCKSILSENGNWKRKYYYLKKKKLLTQKYQLKT